MLPNKATAMEPARYLQNLSYALQTFIQPKLLFPFKPIYATLPAAPVAEAIIPSISCTKSW